MPGCAAAGAAIDVTCSVWQEPAGRVDNLCGDLGQAGLAAIHSTYDECVPVAAVEPNFDNESQPGRLWKRAASYHRFSNDVAELDRPVLEALTGAAAARPS
jgi:hypothetical protein